jgi:hypothetical protein
MLRKAIPQQLTNASGRAQAGARLDFDRAEIFAEIAVATAASHCGVAARHQVGERQRHFGSGQSAALLGPIGEAPIREALVLLLTGRNCFGFA